MSDKLVVPLRAVKPEFPLLSPESAREASVLYNNNNFNTINPNDLPRDKCSAGGATDFRVPSPEGESTVKTLHVIAVQSRPARLYWRGDAKQGRPPDCTSRDGLTGVGNPGGDCTKCPMSRFGTAARGHGQACKLIQQMLVLHPNEIVPHLISVPPTSLKNCNQYFLGLLSRSIPYWNVITQIILERASNEDGIQYARMVFTLERYMTDEERASFAPFQESMAKMLSPILVSSNDYVTDEPDTPSRSSAPPEQESNPDRIPF